ncbi:MAG: ankyrin repeat domain-containing protein [Oligoflexia bacterium]|nr:ankyrin repeat domain-containing protein [Oligoflexia bacterium]
MHKINIDQTTDDQAATLLYMAAQEGHNEVVELLLKNNASVDKAIDKFKCRSDEISYLVILIIFGT